MSGLDGKGTKFPNGINVDKDELFIADVAVTTTAAELNVLDGINQSTAQLNAASLFVYHYEIEDLNAGANIAARPIFAVPTGYTITLTSADIVPQGDDEGVDESNTCAVSVLNGSNAIVTQTYNNVAESGVAFPNAGIVGNLGTLNATHKVLAAGAVVKLSVTNGTTANPPGMMLRLVGTIAVA